MIIGLCGRMRSGKDTVANILCDRYADVSRTAFAETLKQSAAAALGLTVDELEALKTNDTPWTLGGLHSFTAREFLQRYGTEAHRDIFGKQFWIDNTFSRLTWSKIKHVVITDVRFPNEADAIRAHSGALVKVSRSQAETQPVTHASEQDLTDKCDAIVVNNYDVDKLVMAVDELIVQLGKLNPEEKFRKKGNPIVIDPNPAATFPL